MSTPTEFVYIVYEHYPTDEPLSMPYSDVLGIYRTREEAVVEIQRKLNTIQKSSYYHYTIVRHKMDIPGVTNLDIEVLYDSKRHTIDENLAIVKKQKHRPSSRFMGHYKCYYDSNSEDET